MKMGDHLQAKPVYDLSPVGFLEVAATLAGCRDIGGREFKCTPKFCLGARTVKAFKKLCGAVLLVTAGWENKLPRVLDSAGC